MICAAPCLLLIAMKKLEKYIVNKTYSLEETMKAIDSNSMGFALVCDDRKLVGIVTDGDIRRCLLAGGGLQENICRAVNKKPHFVYEDERYLAESIMVQEEVAIIPVVNENHEIVDIVFSEPGRNTCKKEHINIPLVIMAGGKGTRLWPYTNILPKPLIPIDGITITEQIMNRFSAYGCNDIYMIVNYMKDFIKSYFKEKNVRQNIHFIEEETFLGTGGGLKYIKGVIKEAFFMTNCDVLIDCDYAEILASHKEQGNIVTMVCARKNMVVPYGTIEIGREHQILSMQEKPAVEYNINTGIYLVEPELLDLIPENESIHFPQLIALAMKHGKKAGTYVIDGEQWMDMGQLEELEQMKYKLEQF